MKKGLIYAIYVLIVGFIVTFTTIKIVNHDEDTKTLKVSEVTHSIFYAPFYAAIENGYFDDYGIKIDLTLVSGSDNVAASVLSNDTHIGLAGPESAIYVYAGGEKDYLEVFAGLTKRDGQFLISRNKDFEWNDLEGKEILIGRRTGMPGLCFLKALENEGIDESDVKINTSVEFAELSGAFIGGTGDFVNLFEPIATKLENNNEGYVVKSVGLSSDAFPYTAFYARKSFVKENKSDLEKFTKAINKGLEFVVNNDDENIAKAVKKQFKDTSLSDLTAQIKRYKEADVWLKTPFIEENFYNTLVDLLKDNNLLKSTVYYEDLINNLYE